MKTKTTWLFQFQFQLVRSGTLTITTIYMIERWFNLRLFSLAWPWLLFLVLAFVVVGGSWLWLESRGRDSLVPTTLHTAGTGTERNKTKL